MFGLIPEQLKRPRKAKVGRVQGREVLPFSAADKKAVIADLQRQLTAPPGKRPQRKPDLVGQIENLPRFKEGREDIIRSFAEYAKKWKLDAAGRLLRKKPNKNTKGVLAVTVEEVPGLVAQLHNQSHHRSDRKFNKTAVLTTLEETYFLDTNMDDVVEEEVARLEASCRLCAAERKPVTTVPHHQPIIATEPMQHCQLDLTILKRAPGKPVLFCLLDVNSKYAHVRILPNKSATSVFNAFKEICLLEGLPLKLQT